MRPNTRLVHVETPTNPLIRICDIRAAADIAHEGDALLMVDSTFASPFNQQPLALGADVSMHSSTKYLNGHSDIIGGVLVLNDDELAEDIHFVRKSSGAVPGPMDAWLCLRGIRTLHVRMPYHNENGLAVARFLESHSAVERVFYPGLESHPQHGLAAQQMSGYSGMVSVDLGDPARARPWPPILVCSSLRRVWEVSNLSSAYRHSRPTHRCRRGYVRHWASRRDS